MSSYAVKKTLPDYILGDAWLGIPVIGPVTLVGVTQGTLSRIELQFISPSKLTTFVFDSTAGADGAIVIDDTLTWEAHIDPTTDFIQELGVWTWSMRFTHSASMSPITCFEGEITVTNPV